LPTALGYTGSGIFTALAAYSTTPGTAVLDFVEMFFLYFAVAAKWTLITAVSPHREPLPSPRLSRGLQR